MAKEVKDVKEEKKKKSEKPELTGVEKAKKRRSAKVFKHTTMATVLTVIFIAAVVLVNIVASVIFDRYPLTIDLTENSKYSISDETTEYVKSIDKEIKITVLASESAFENFSEYTVQAMELLNRYREYNPKISVQYADLLQNPEIKSNYTNIDLFDYDIIFETVNTSAAGEDDFDRIKIVHLTDLVSWSADFTSQLSQTGMTIDSLGEYYGYERVVAAYAGYIVASNAESAFTSAIMTITDPDPVGVTVLTGHDELAEITYFEQMLSANGYELSQINIMTEDIPESTDLLIIPAPAEDYLDEDIKKISDFLLNGGSLEKDALYIASVQQGDTPNLDEFLEEYGIKIQKTMILEQDTSRYYAGQQYLTLPRIVSENYMQDMHTDDYLLYMPMARPVTQLFEQQDMTVTEAFVQSTSSAVTCGYNDIGFDSSDITDRGVQTSIAIASKAAFLDEDTVYSNILVLGSDQFVSDSALQAPQFQNSEYIISLLNGVTGKTNTGIVIATKTITGNTFDLTQRQSSILKWTFQLIIPLLVLAVNFIVYKKRKNK